MSTIASSSDADTQAHAGDDSALVRGIDRLTRATTALTCTALVVLACITCYEVLSRYLLNAPTYWVTEVATYLLVGLTFMSLATVQRANDHVQVEVAIAFLSPSRRAAVELVATWIGLFFVVVVTWQVIAFNYNTFVHDSRAWGLLRTPLWIPQVFVSLGYIAFALSLIAHVYRLRAPATRLRHWLLPAVFVVLAGVLSTLGRHAPPIVEGSHFDWGTLAIAAAFAVAIAAWSGVRTMLAVAGFYAVMVVAFWQAQGASLVVIGGLLVVALLVMLAAGIRVALALGITGLLGVKFLLPEAQLSMLAERSWTSVNSFSLTAVPMFVFMGALLLRSGVMGELFDALMCWFGRIRGGIAYTSVAASTMFAAVSGSSLATAATLGTVACPEMIRRGYSPRLTYGVVAAGATLGILIPPSIAMIIYGTTVGAPVTVLFVAGIVPGLILMLALMVAVFGWSMLAPGDAPAGDAFSWPDKVRAFSSAFPFVLVIVLVLGSLYAGIATPTEAGAIGTAVAFALCVLRGKLSWSLVRETTTESVKITGFLLFLVVGASMMSVVFDYLRIPRMLVEFVQAADLAPTLLMAVVGLIYILLGMFIDPISMMLMTLPVTFPLVTSLGFDEIWFGVVLVLVIEVGLITPPVGMVLFILRGMSGDTSLREIVYGVLPFMLIILAFIVFLYFFPEIVHWLPRRMEG